MNIERRTLGFRSPPPRMVALRQKQSVGLDRTVWGNNRAAFQFIPTGTAGLPRRGKGWIRASCTLTMSPTTCTCGRNCCAHSGHNQRYMVLRWHSLPLLLQRSISTRKNLPVSWDGPGAEHLSLAHFPYIMRPCVTRLGLSLVVVMINARQGLRCNA